MRRQVREDEMIDPNAKRYTKRCRRRPRRRVRCPDPILVDLPITRVRASGSFKPGRYYYLGGGAALAP